MCRRRTLTLERQGRYTGEVFLIIATGRCDVDELRDIDKEEVVNMTSFLFQWLSS